VIKSNIGRDYGELLMGHVLRGSQENYISRQGMVEDLEEAYKRIDFSRSVDPEKRKYEEMEKHVHEQNEEINHLRNEIGNKSSTS
jgi:hypothetical protein